MRHIGRPALHTSTTFGGDVSGKYNATVVASATSPTITGDTTISTNSADYKPVLDIKNINAGAYAGLLKFTSTYGATAYTPAQIRAYGGTGSSDGELAFETAGSERLRIDGTGRVGVNVDPSALLHIHKSTGASAYITSDSNTNDSAWTALWFAHNYSTSADWAGIIFDADDKLRITNSGSGNSSHFVMDDSGRIGIGHSAPQNHSLLHVKGDMGGEPYCAVVSEETNTSTGYGGFQAKAVKQAHYRYAINGNNKFQTRVGMGTGADKWSLYSWTQSADTIVCDGASGSIGINTTTPSSSYKLDVNGSALIQGNITTTQASSISYTASDDYLIYYDDKEVSQVENNASWQTQKTVDVSKAGTLRVKFEAYIQSGNDWWAWQITKNGTQFSTGSYGQGLDTGQSASVHNYRRFKVDVTGVTPGDTIAVNMKASDSSGGGWGSGGSQNLYLKNFRLYSGSPSVDFGNGTDSRNNILIGADHIKIEQGSETQNLKISSTNPADTSVGATFYDGGGNWRIQLYGSGNGYGFLASNWGAWDLRKVISGDLSLNNSTANKVWHGGNDGSGSGLDADTLDGSQPSALLVGSATTLDAGTNYQTSQSTLASSRTRGMEIDFVQSAQGWPSYGTVVTAKSYSGGGGTFQLYNGYGSGYGGNYLRYRNADYSAGSSNPPWTSWYTMWHSGNDGSGSGLDADTCDGQHLGTSAYPVFNYIHLNGTLNQVTGTGSWIGRNYAYDTCELLGYGAEFMIGAQSQTIHINYRYANGHSTYTPSNWYWRAGTSSNWSNHNFGSVTANGNITATGTVTSYSDRRLKEDIRPIENALDKVRKLEGIHYTIKETGVKEVGLIAQDVIEVVPELVNIIDSRVDDPHEGLINGLENLHVMKYQNAVALLVEAIKEQQAEIEELKTKVSYIN